MPVAPWTGDPVAAIAKPDAGGSHVPVVKRVPVGLEQLVDEAVAWLDLRRRLSRGKEQGGIIGFSHHLFARRRSVDDVFVPRQKRVGLTEATEGTLCTT